MQKLTPSLWSGAPQHWLWSAAHHTTLDSFSTSLGFSPAALAQGTGWRQAWVFLLGTKAKSQRKLRRSLSHYQVKSWVQMFLLQPNSIRPRTFCMTKPSLVPTSWEQAWNCPCLVSSVLPLTPQRTGLVPSLKLLFLLGCFYSVVTVPLYLTHCAQATIRENPPSAPLFPKHWVLWDRSTHDHVPSIEPRPFHPFITSLYSPSFNCHSLHSSPLSPTLPTYSPYLTLAYTHNSNTRMVWWVVGSYFPGPWKAIARYWPLSPRQCACIRKGGES